MQLNSDTNSKITDNDFDFKQEFYKYIYFYKYFIISIVISLFCAFLIIRYSGEIYISNAKIKILDKKESALQLPSAEDLFSNSKINIENELQIINSYPILYNLVEDLNLHSLVYAQGNVNNTLITDFPFKFALNLPYSQLSESEYKLELLDNGLLITDNNDDGKEYLFNDYSTYDKVHNLPYEIYEIDKEKWLNNIFLIKQKPINAVVKDLKKNISANPVGDKSDVISISYKCENQNFGNTILNTLIDIFNNDGIKDKQLVHKRTIEFVNERYNYLSLELDSIEQIKETFKTNNELIDLSINSNVSLSKITKSEEELFNINNQISIIRLLINNLKSTDLELLPSNIGIENLQINILISNYNELILQRRKLKFSAGSNNPSIIQFDVLIDDSRKNILSSLNNQLTQLISLKDNLLLKFNEFDNQVTVLPEQEKVLRSIERNQILKEALYLFLLQKREEAEVSFAVTEPSIKVVEYSVISNDPIHPNVKMILLLAFLVGFLIPFFVLYFIFLYDNKVHTREDIEKFSLNVLGEIPFFDLSESEKVFLNPDDRSIISESFRILMSNVRYLQNNDSSSNVLLVTSSIKGEGKTLNALNLALSFSSVGKKVLLIGCDLRNPQIHKYINYDKNVSGIVDFLVDNKTNWKESIINPFENHPLLDIILSGPLPPNPLNLIDNGNIDILLKDAKKTYDHIIIDSAPTLLVADTQSLISKSDVLIFITRCNVTDNEVLSHIQKISNESNTNLGVVLNGVGQKNSYGYSYGYRYGYGYNYKYSYNYGYGYGYLSDDDKS